MQRAAPLRSSYNTHHESEHSTGYEYSSRDGLATTEGTMHMLSSNSPAQPSDDAPIADRIEFLHSQLDTFGETRPLIGQFCLLGYSHRRQGGVALACCNALSLPVCGACGSTS